MAIEFGSAVYAPEQVTLISSEGKVEDITLELAGNYYQYEAIEVVRCIEAGETCSPMWSWEDSIMLIDILDEIRRQIGLVYEGHDID